MRGKAFKQIKPLIKSVSSLNRIFKALHLFASNMPSGAFLTNICHFDRKQKCVWHQCQLINFIKSMFFPLRLKV